MIKNESQRKQTLALLGKLESELAALKSNSTGGDTNSDLIATQTNALNRMVDQFQEQLKDYHRLKDGEVKSFHAASLAELPIELIKARIASGRTEVELGESLGVEPEVVEDWEEYEYEGVSTSELRRVCNVLDVRCDDPEFDVSTAVRDTSFSGWLERHGLSFVSILPLLPSKLRAMLSEGSGQAQGATLAVRLLSKIFGIPADSLDVSREITAVPAIADVKRGSDDAEPPPILDINFQVPEYLSDLVVNAWRASPEHSLASLEQQLAAIEYSHESLLGCAWASGIALLAIDGLNDFEGGLWVRDDRFVGFVTKRDAETVLSRDIFYLIGAAILWPSREAQKCLTLDQIRKLPEVLQFAGRLSAGWMSDVDMVHPAILIRSAISNLDVSALDPIEQQIFERFFF